MIVLVLVVGIVFLTRTGRQTPFLRWGLILAVLGAVVFMSPVLFAARAVPVGVALFAVGGVVYYYGRFVRREQFFFSKP